MVIKAYISIRTVNRIAYEQRCLQTIRTLEEIFTNIRQRIGLKKKKRQKKRDLNPKVRA